MWLGAAAVKAGYSLLHVPSTGSTTDLALEAADAGEAGNRWFVADRQTAGRGRQGRAWTSPAGNLHATLLLLDPAPPADAPKLGFVAGVAAREALAGLTPALGGLVLKWPNDLLLDDAKIAGILLEGRAPAPGRTAIAIGIGINVAEAPAGLPYPATHAAAHDPRIDAARVFEALSDAMARWLTLFDRGRGFPAVLDRWREYALPPGTPLRARRSADIVDGFYAGIDETGRLLLDTDAGLLCIEAADVYMRPAPATAGA